MAKTPVKGLDSTVSRDGNKFTTTWKNPDKLEKQEIRAWAKTDGAWESVGKAASVGKSKQAYSHTVNHNNSRSFSSFYPWTYTKLSKFGFKRRVQVKGKTWSDWSDMVSFDLEVPKKPSGLGNPQIIDSNTFSYSWQNNAGNKTNQNKSGPVCTAFEWQTIIVADGADANWSLCNTQTITRINATDEEVTPDSKSKGRMKYNNSHLEIIIAEKQADVAAGMRRYFRVRAQGPQGNSDWVVRDHKLGGQNTENINPDTDVSIEASTGTSTSVTLNLKGYKLEPGDYMEIDYALVPPYIYTYDDEGDFLRSEIRLPNGFNDWTKFKTYTDTGKPDTPTYDLPVFISDDHCLFMRINYIHDGDTYPGTPFLVNKKTNIKSRATVNALGSSTAQKKKTTTTYEVQGTGSGKNRIGAVVSTSYTTTPVSSLNLASVVAQGLMSSIVVNNEVEATSDVVVGTLSPPTLNSIVATTPDEVVTINVTNNAQLDSAGNKSVVAVYCATASNPDPTVPCAIIPYSESGNDYSFKTSWPAGEDPTFKIECLVCDYSPKTKTTAATSYTIENIKMISGSESEGTSVPKAASNINVTREAAGIAKVTWDWTWDEATGAELSWAEDITAWESTEQPSTYVITGNRVGKWYIGGLDATTYYVRVRFFKQSGDTVIYGAYTDVTAGKITMSSAPNAPTLYLSTNVANVDDDITATWVYESTDGTSQASAVFAEATRASESDPWTYTSLEQYGGSVETAKSFTFQPSKFGWETGTQHYICVRPTSASGKDAKDWSNPLTTGPINVRPRPVPVVTGIGGESDALKPQTIPDDDPEQVVNIPLALTKLPLTFTVSGAGAGGHVTASIVRSGPSNAERPDESRTEHFDGEIIASKTVTADATTVDDNLVVTFTRQELINTLDLLESYVLKISITDAFGQTVSVDPDYSFRVYWDRYSQIPEATINLDYDNDRVLITPTAPETVSEGDYCQIYRLSVDKPQLILDNGEFGKTYIDSYPTYGYYGGYRIVYYTSYGDYKTEDNVYAWTDYSPRSENLKAFTKFVVTIDFDGQTLEFPGNIALSGSWAKDFQTTKYLGGAIQGDWNPGVNRTGSINGHVPVGHEPETVYMMRKLADFAGVCHVRTPEGSNFYADVQVKDDREEKWVNKISKISLTYTKIDGRENEMETLEGE